MRILDTEKELQKAENNLKDFLDRNRRIENSPALMLEQERLSREASVLTGVYTTLKQKLETTKIEAVGESDYVIVIDPPYTPLFPTKPKKRLTVILYGIFGLAIGLVIAFIDQYFKDMGRAQKRKITKIVDDLKKVLEY